MYRRWLMLAISLMLASGCAEEGGEDPLPVAPTRAPANPGIWTPADQAMVIEAFIADTKQYPGKWVELADAVRAAGNDTAAKEVLVKAGSAAQSGDSLTDTSRASIAGRLAALGDDMDAEALAPLDGTAPARALFLSALGTGRAKAGNVEGARQTAASVASLRGPPGPLELSQRSDALRAFSFGPGSQSDMDDAFRIRDDLSEATASIALAMAAAGAVDEASEVANDLPDGLAKLRYLSEAAWQLCRDERGREKGRQLAAQTSALVQRLMGTSGDPSIDVTLAATAARVIARCDGPAQAIAFAKDTLAPEPAQRALASLVRQLALRQALDLAHEIVPALEPSDTQSMINAMDELEALSLGLAKTGERAAAAMAASDAKEIAAKISREATIPDFPSGNGGDGLDREIFTAFALAGADEQAPFSPRDCHVRLAAYSSALLFDIARGDSVAIRRIVRKMLDEGQSPPLTAAEAAELRAQLAMILATAGYVHQARAIHDKFFGAASTSRASLTPRSRAALNAALGDIPGALAAAEKAGPLLRTAPATPGPRAWILIEIVGLLSVQGRIAEALQVEAELENGAADMVNLTAMALVTIAKAQQRAGHAEDALATVLRILAPLQRPPILLELAAIPASP